MSIANSVRAALRIAYGPLTAKELREACDEDYDAKQIGSALNALETAGEIEVNRDARPLTYVCTPKLERAAAAPLDPPAAEHAADNATDAIPPAAVPALPAQPVTHSPSPISSVVDGHDNSTIERLIKQQVTRASAIALRETHPIISGEITPEIAVARRAAGLMLEHWPDAKLPPPVHAFVLDAMGGAA